MIRLRAEAPSTSHSPPPHIILSRTRADTPPSGIALSPRYEVGESSSAPTTRPPRGFRAYYGFVATIDKEIIRDLERDVGYGITDTWDEMPVDMPGAPATDDTELDDEQSERQLMAGRLNMLYRDRRAHARTARLIEAEARMSREAWGRSMDASDLAGPQEIGSNYRDAGDRSHETGAVHRGAETAEETSDSDDIV
ncbi:hypothetical protein Tco_0081160 [Tanacetum coccineum]